MGNFHLRTCLPKKVYINQLFIDFSLTIYEKNKLAGKQGSKKEGYM